MRGREAVSRRRVAELGRGEVDSWRSRERGRRRERGRSRERERSRFREGRSKVGRGEVERGREA